MPLYDFKDTNSGEYFEKFLTLDEREAFLNDNPQIKQIHIKGLTAVSGIDVRPSDGWNDVLKSVKKANYKSTIETW
jgi:hypothetical protein